jgi:hypothetical protein
VAEQVDALDSGSSGQYACGGSSPPLDTREKGYNLWSTYLGLTKGDLCVIITSCCGLSIPQNPQVNREVGFSHAQICS